MQTKQKEHLPLVLQPWRYMGERWCCICPKHVRPHIPAFLSSSCTYGVCVAVILPQRKYASEIWVTIGVDSGTVGPTQSRRKQKQNPNSSFPIFIFSQLSRAAFCPSQIPPLLCTFLLKIASSSFLSSLNVRVFSLVASRAITFEIQPAPVLFCNQFWYSSPTPS